MQEETGGPRTLGAESQPLAEPEHVGGERRRQLDQHAIEFAYVEPRLGCRQRFERIAHGDDDDIACSSAEGGEAKAIGPTRIHAPVPVLDPE